MITRRQTVLGSLAITLVAGVLGVRQLLAPPQTAPAYTGARPAIATDGFVTHIEEIVVDMPLQQYYQWSTQTPLEAVLPGAGGIPRVLRTEVVQGSWNASGARRRVVLEDGHYAAEEVIANDNATVFRYQVWGYTNAARFLTDYAIGEFRLEDAAGKTRVTWTYAFHERSLIVRPFLAQFVRGTWAPYMGSVLQSMKQSSEQSIIAPEPSGP